MTIAYVVSINVPSRGADTIHIMKMCNAFAKEGNAVTLIIPEYADTKSSDVDVFEYYGISKSFDIQKVAIRLPNMKTKHIRRVYSLARHAARGSYDCYFTRDLRIGFVLTKIFRKHVILEYHEALKQGTADDKMFRMMHKSGCIRKLVVITEALKKRFISQYGLDDDFVYVAPDCADTPPDTAAPAELTQESNGMFHVGYIGHLYKGRGLELLGDMAAACPFAYFHIVGGNEQDIEYWQNEYKHIKNIHFYGFVPPAMTVSFGKAVDVLIAPYQYVVATEAGLDIAESTAQWMSPMKIFEYMAMGKPIISSDHSVLKEVLTDGENSLLCTPDDAAAWSEAINRLRTDRKLAKTLADNALSASAKYTWTARAKNLMEHVFAEKKAIVLITDAFPYYQDGYETFLETEISYCKNKMYIFALRGDGGGSCYPLPEGCGSYATKRHGVLRRLLGSLGALCHAVTLTEIGRMLASRRLSFYNLEKLLVFVRKGRAAATFIKKTLRRENLSKDTQIIFYSYWMYYHAYAAVLLQRYFINSRVVTRCHEYDLYIERLGDNYTPLRVFLAKRINKFCPCSQDGYNYLVKRYHVDSTHIATARLGTCDYGIAMPGSRQVFRIVSCSSVNEQKRVHLIVDALAHICDTNIDWTHFGIGELLPEVREKAEKCLTKKNNIHLIWKGFVPNAEYMIYCKENPFHLLINVSESEGIPVSIMEALSFGTPILATKVGGIPEIVHHEINGRLMDKDITPAEIADAIKMFADMPGSEYARYRQKARETWEEMCSADKEYSAFYTQLSSLRT